MKSKHGWAVVPIAVALAGCGARAALPPSVIRVLAESPTGLVAIEGVDGGSYAHPATLADWRLAEMLRLVHYEDPNEPAPRPLFSEEEVAFLAPAVGDALTRAEVSNRVVFHVEATKEDGYGKGTRVTSGRLFVRGHDLVLAVGDCSTPAGVDPPRGLLFDGDPTLRRPPGTWRLVLVDPDRPGPPRRSEEFPDHWIAIPLSVPVP